MTSAASYRFVATFVPTAAMLKMLATRPISAIVSFSYVEEERRIRRDNNREERNHEDEEGDLRVVSAVAELTATLFRRVHSAR